MSFQSILDNCGLNVKRYEQVHGGDINQTWRLYANDDSYFLKVNDAGLYPGMFQKEASGLIALANEISTLPIAAPVKIPAVIKQGTAAASQYLLLEWIDKGRPAQNFWEHLGTCLALLHKKEQPHFGWTQDNYIGSLVQLNAQYDSWDTFFTECRIIPMVRRLFDSGEFSKHDIALAETFCKKVIHKFPVESPSLLHGDLWAGNFMVASTGLAAIYDPAVYYGHREMDIGMTKLFGGFDDRFYSAYNDTFPLEKDWRNRIQLTQLYPLLVHAVLFGAHYIHSAREILKTFS